MSQRRLWAELTLLFVGQVLLLTAFRVALPGDVAANEGSDFSAFYRPVAEQVADGHGLAFDDTGTPATRYPPGYPLVLGAAFVVGDRVGLARDDVIAPLTVALTALAGVLLHLVARRVFDRRHAWISSVVWLGYPLVLWTSKQPNSEIPFMVVVYAAVLVLVPALTAGRTGWRRMAAAGLLFGLATVVRPAGLALLPAVGLVLWLCFRSDRGHALRRTATFAAAFAVPVLVVSAWMTSAVGTPTLLSDANDANVVEGLSFAVDSPGEAADLPMPAGLRAFVVETHAREGELLREDTTGDYVRQAVLDRPLVVGELIAYKAVRSWYGTESFRFEGVLLATQVLWVGAAAAGAWACRRRGRGPRWYLALVVSTTVFTWGAAVVALSIVRYLVPCLGLFAPFVAVALLAVGEGVAVRLGREPGTAPRPADG